MTGKARAKAHKAEARHKAQQDRWAVQAESENNRDAIAAQRALGAQFRGVFFPTHGVRMVRALQRFAKGR